MNEDKATFACAKVALSFRAVPGKFFLLPDFTGGGGGIRNPDVIQSITKASDLIPEKQGLMDIAQKHPSS